MFNFRQRFLWSLDPLYDSARGVLQLQRAVDEARREFGGIDFLHLFDWGQVTGVGRIYGRTGDLSPYDSLRGGREALRPAIAAVQAQQVPVGLYIEGYLLEQRGRLGQQSGAAWQLVGARRPQTVLARQHRDVHLSGRGRVARGPGLDLRDQGPGTGRGRHVHRRVRLRGREQGLLVARARPRGAQLPGGRRAGCTRMIRERIAGIRPNVAIYTEETPVDVTSQYQDGSFTYAMLSAQQARTRCR